MMTDRVLPSGLAAVPRHGGALAAASAVYGIAPGAWLDLSTGINPVAYPLNPFGDGDLSRLPDPDALAELTEVARAAYGARENVQIVAVPGTDLALRLLPLLRPRASVAILSPTYSGHEEAWTSAGHRVVRCFTIDAAEDAAPVMVLANPNNPDGRIVPPSNLIDVAQRLASIGGMLVVDEAFADIAPDASVVPFVDGVPMIVLRSFGKFYGLAGLRLGFAIGPAEATEPLRRLMGDWPVSGPAIALGRLALADRNWQAATRERLAGHRRRLDALLESLGFGDIVGTDLFRLVRTADAGELHVALARRGIWTRIFAESGDWIRFGLPNAEGFDLLERALAGIRAAAPIRI